MSRDLRCDVCGKDIKFFMWGREWKVVKISEDVWAGRWKKKMDVCNMCWYRIQMTIKSFVEKEKHECPICRNEHGGEHG